MCSTMANLLSRDCEKVYEVSVKCVEERWNGLKEYKDFAEVVGPREWVLFFVGNSGMEDMFNFMRKWHLLS
jgi:hypothetical protein